MVTSIKFTLSDEGGQLSGELTRHTVPKLSNKVVKQLIANSAIILDLKQVKKVDTAGLAWLLALVEQAQVNACQLTLTHLPSDLIKLAKLSAVDDFLPLSSSTIVAH